MCPTDEAPRAARDGDFELVTLRSGLRAVRHLGHGEVMHPSIGPWNEANRLYVDGLGLRARLASGEAGGRAVSLVSLERDLDALRLARSDPEGFPFLAAISPELDALLADGQVE